MHLIKFSYSLVSSPCKVTSNNKNPPEYTFFSSSDFPLSKGQQWNSYRASPSAEMLASLMPRAGMPCHVAWTFSLYSHQILFLHKNPIRLFHVKKATFLASSPLPVSYSLTPYKSPCLFVSFVNVMLSSSFGEKTVLAVMAVMGCIWLVILNNLILYLVLCRNHRFLFL